jgi:hypothetical protein
MDVDDGRATANRWFYEDAAGLFVMDVPDALPAPRCSFCGREIRELTLGMLVWNENSTFNGFHFIHKGGCDPKNPLAGGIDTYRFSHELYDILISPYTLGEFWAKAAWVMSEHHVTPLALETTNYALAFMTALGTVAFDESRINWAELGHALDQLRP